MVFWSKLRQAIKSSVSKLDFLKLEKKVKTNESDIAINKEQINVLNENVNTNSSDIQAIKRDYAKKSITNSFTAKQNLDQGANFRGDLKVLDDKQLQVGYTESDIKLKVYCDQGQKHMNLENPQGDLKFKTPNGSIFMQPRDTMNMGNKRIDNLANPTNNQDAATKKYVDDKVATTQNDLDTQKTIIQNIEERIDEIPNTYLSKQDATNTYLSKVDANANYGRLTNGISNDWNSTNIFRKSPQNMGTITNAKDLVTKEYVDSNIGVIKKRTITLAPTIFDHWVGKWNSLTITRIPATWNVLNVKYKVTVPNKGTWTGFFNRLYGLNASGTSVTSDFDIQFSFQSDTQQNDRPMIWLLTNLTGQPTIDITFDIIYFE